MGTHSIQMQMKKNQDSQHWFQKKIDVDEENTEKDK